MINNTSTNEAHYTFPVGSILGPGSNQGDAKLISVQYNLLFKYFSQPPSVMVQ
jgi:hypothetical protein